MSELTDDEIDLLVFAGGPDADHEDVIEAVKNILAARRPRIEAEALRRMADEAEEIARIGESPRVRTTPEDYRKWALSRISDLDRLDSAEVQDWLRAEADRLDPKEA